MKLTNRNSADNFSVTRIPAFSDNYLWLLDNGQSAIAVDPGDAQVIIAELEAKQLQLDYILTTHHHADHIGGVTELQSRYNAKVIGPDSDYIPQVTQTVSDGEQINLLGLSIDVISVPGHTLDHIAYFIASPNPLLFCGDTLFAGGCGRLFEGTPAQMRHSLGKLRELPANTLVHCAHEYTQANLAFALAVEPNNSDLIQRIATVDSLRKKQQATVPSLLSEELATNPFLRYDNADVVSAAMQRTEQSSLNADEVFGAIRQWKDTF